MTFYAQKLSGKSLNFVGLCYYITSLNNASTQIFCMCKFCLWCAEGFLKVQTSQQWSWLEIKTKCFSLVGHSAKQFAITTINSALLSKIQSRERETQNLK